MKSVAEFQQYYRDTLEPRLKQLDERRKNEVKAELQVLAGLICANLLLFFLTEMLGSDELWVCFVAGIASIVVLYVLHRKKYSPFYNEFKSSIIGGIIAFIDHSLDYYPGNYISEHEFKYSNIFRQSADRYSGSDYVCGVVGRTDISFSQVHAEYKTETTHEDADGHTRTEEHWHTIFQGIFFVADFNKHFSTQTLVWPDASLQTLGNSLGSVFRSLTKRRSIFNGGWQTIKLEDPEFERYFVVYGFDQVESRYILSASLVKRILEFRKRVGTKLYISFLASKIYVAIPCGTLFEPSFYSSILDYGMVLQYFSYLDLTIGIVEDFNLNRRIWSKQPAEFKDQASEVGK